MSIGIVLSGGGARAYAHLGVLEALREADVKWDAVSGASGGAIMGAFIADGKEPRETFGIMKRYNMMDFARFNLSSLGLMDLSRLEKHLNKHLAAKTFEELKLPFWTSVSNLRTGWAEYLHTGPLAQAVCASSSIPFLFAPVRIGDEVYADGGLLDNLPFSPLVGHCETIITVNVSRSGEAKKLSSLKDITIRSIEIVLEQDHQDARSHSSLYIEPEGAEKYFVFDTGHADELYNLGYWYTKKLLAE